MMKILLQLLILTIFIFSNGYQSIVTSFMLNPMQEKLLKTVDELIDSDLKIEIMHKNFLQDSPKFQKMAENRFANDFGDGKAVAIGSSEAVEMKLVDLLDCKLIKSDIDYRGDGKSFDGYYLIPEVVASKELDLRPRPFHPYFDKFQELMDRTFVAGLYQAWERFFWEKFIENRWGRKQKKAEEKDTLDFGLITPFFLILAFGFSAALFALFCEIFVHDFVAKLSREYFKRKKEEIFKRRIGKAKLRKVQRGKVQKRKLKVKFIKVRPAPVHKVRPATV